MVDCNGLNPYFRFVDRDMYMRYRGDGIGHLDPLVRSSSSNTTGERQPGIAGLDTDSLTDILEEPPECVDESRSTSSDPDSGDSTDSDTSEETMSEEADSDEASEEES